MDVTGFTDADATGTSCPTTQKGNPLLGSSGRWHTLYFDTAQGARSWSCGVCLVLLLVIPNLILDGGQTLLESCKVLELCGKQSPSKGGRSV